MNDTNQSCEYCDGQEGMENRLVTVYRHRKGRHFIFENVPARRKFLRQPQTEASYVTRVVGAYALAYPHVAFLLEVDGRRTIVTDGRGDQVAAAVGVWGDEIASAMAPLRTPDDAPGGYGVEGMVSLPHLDRATRQAQLTRRPSASAGGAPLTEGHRRSTWPAAWHRW